MIRLLARLLVLCLVEPLAGLSFWLGRFGLLWSNIKLGESFRHVRHPLAGPEPWDEFLLRRLHRAAGLRHRRGRRA